MRNFWWIIELNRIYLLLSIQALILALFAFLYYIQYAEICNRLNGERNKLEKMVVSRGMELRTKNIGREISKKKLTLTETI